VVTRDGLLRDVWGQSFSGSNVVDAVVKSPRRKLGPHVRAIATATGHGYRFAGFATG
jgi:DNA-binding response OmpR family regulator